MEIPPGKPGVFSCLTGRTSCEGGIKLWNPTALQPWYLKLPAYASLRRVGLSTYLVTSAVALTVRISRF